MMSILSGKSAFMTGAILLTVGGGIGISSEMSKRMGDELDRIESAAVETAPVPQVEQAAAVPTPVVNDTGTETGTYLKLTTQRPATFVLSAPTIEGGKILVNGNTVLDVSQLATENGAQSDTFKAFVALPIGEHVIELIGPYQGGEFQSKIQIGELGGQSTSLTSVASAVSGPEVMEMVASLGNFTDASAAAQQQQAPFVPGAGRRGFEIGGSSASSKTNGGGNGGAAGQSGSMQNAGAQMHSGFGTQMAAAGMSGGTTGTTTTGTTTTGTTTTGSSVFSGLTSGSGGNTGSGTTGGGSSSGGGSLPPAIVTPPPTVVPPVTPMANAASSSPLTPPSNVQLTQAVQLTSAGSEEGMVASSGSTLFGQVQDPQAFDIVNASISSGRTTTVDVGATNGQFAVRLFPEDFASGEEVQVTLTGANSTNSEVEATPVTYAVTGAEATDGLAQVLGRLTFGATPELYARVKAIGFEAYVTEQLSPETINDTAFEALNPQQLYFDENNGRNSIFRSLNELQIGYAAFTEKQLNEVMANFWFNHFHASPKSGDRYSQVLVDRNAFRDLALTNFNDLLQYSAKSPLMSEFLDNNESRVGRLNENYARELLELHTVGVNGGYTDEDIIEVARIFTGWRYAQTNEGVADDVQKTWEYAFIEDRHDGGDKTVTIVDTTIGGGQAEGERFLSLLAVHPETQNFVCGKLVEFLVSDTPIPSMQANCAAAWEASQGDVKEMLRAIILDPSYITTATLKRNKIKTPFEYAASAVRVLGVEPNFEDDSYLDDFRKVMEDAGFNPMYYPVPTGLAEVGSAWLGSGSVQLAFERMSDVTRKSEDYGIDTLGEIRDAGLETAEEVAAYLLALATADHYSLAEFEAMVDVLKGEDGIFEPMIEDESDALGKAKGLLVVLPNFQVQ